jgi:hypothetical protein
VPQIKGVVNTDTCLTALTQNYRICYIVHGVYSSIERHSTQLANSFSRPLLRSCSMHVHEQSHQGDPVTLFAASSHSSLTFRRFG